MVAARTLRQIEMDAITEAVARHTAAGLKETEAKKAAAKDLGIGVATLYRRLAELAYHSEKLSQG